MLGRVRSFIYDHSEVRGRRACPGICYFRMDLAWVLFAPLVLFCDISDNFKIISFLILKKYNVFINSLGCHLIFSFPIDPAMKNSDSDC